METRLFGIAAVATLLLLATFAIPVYANPPGAPSGKMVYKFNYIAVPQDSKENFNQDNSGHRIFTLLGERSQHIYWYYNAATGIYIADHLTEAIDGDEAVVYADALGTYTIFVRILGPMKNENHLAICRSYDLDYGVCELGQITLNRKSGPDRFTFPYKLFDLGYENEFWKLDQGSGFRIAEIRLYLEPA